MDSLLWALRNERSNAASNLGNALANIYNQQQETDFKKTAIKWFGDGEVNERKVKQLMEYYPNHQKEVLEIAGQAAAQKTAQDMRDAGTAFMSFLKGRDVSKITQDDIGKFMENTNLSDQAKIMFMTQHLPKLMEIRKQFKAEEYNLGPGEKRMQKSLGGQDVEVASNPTIQKTTALEEAIKQRMSTAGETYDKAYEALTKSAPKKDLVLNEKGEYVPLEPGVKGYQKPDVLSPEAEAQRIKIANATKTPEKPEDVAAKDQERMSKAQLMAGREMGMRYVKDELGGIWSRDGKQIPNAQIEKEYKELVDKFYAQASGKASPVSGGPSSYINKVLKK